MEPAKPASRPITRRGQRPGIGINVLQLPQARITDSDCVEVVPGFRVHVMFGSIFEPQDAILQQAHGCKKWVPVIPHFTDGSVYGQWVRLGGRTATQPGVVSTAKNGTVVVVRAREDNVAGTTRAEEVSSPPQPPVPTPSPAVANDECVPLLTDAALLSQGAVASAIGFSAIDLGVLYKYDRTMHKLDEDFSLMAANLPEGSILAFPAIGVNNGISYYQSAYRMFYSVVSCLMLEGNPMRKLSGVVFMSPFADDRIGSNCSSGCGCGDSTSTSASTGVRTVQHLLNVIKAHRASEGEDFCRQCNVMKQDAVLPCGHRICQRCATDIVLKTNASTCPVCGKWFIKFYPCYRAIDCTSFQCCEPKPDAAANTSAEVAACVAHTACTTCIACTTEVARGATAAPQPDATAKEDGKREEQADSADGKPKEADQPDTCACACTCAGNAEKQTEKRSKIRMMFVPCGHHSVHCDACYASGLRSNKCAVCKEPFFAAVPVPC